MFDKVTITYRGATYEIGRGRDFYGIWTVGAPRSQPLERWPETPEGWSAAWTRFAGIEAPGAIVPVGRRTPPVGQSAAPAGESTAPLSEGAEGTAPFGQDAAPFGRETAPFGQRVVPGGSGRTGAVTSTLLLAAGVACGIAGLFPAYLGGASLAQQPDQLTAHAIYLAVWTASAVLILLGGTRLRLGALLGVGMSIVTFGLFFADAGTAIAGGARVGGAGLVLGVVGWLACAAGSALAFLLRPAIGPGAQGPRDTQRTHGVLGSLRRPRGPEVGPVVLLVLAGLGVAAAFAPAWDSFTLRTAAGQSQTLTAGNAFSNPGLVIAGDVTVMVALAAVVIAAALWRPIRHGAVLLAGAVIPMAAQAISALVQAGEPASPTQFGITPAQASQLGLTISSGVTPAFWVYCGFLIALVVSCAWMLFTPHEGSGIPRDGLGPAPGFPARDAYAWPAAVSDARDPAAPYAGVAAAPAPDGDDTDAAATPDFEGAPRHTAGATHEGDHPAT